MLNKIVHIIDTSKPTEGGDSLLAGHSSYYWWKEGKYKDVFAPIINAKNNDNIVIRKNNKVFFYKISETKTIRPNAKIDISRDVYGKRNLYLMTCVPIGTNINRFLVKAEMEKFISLD